MPDPSPSTASRSRDRQATPTAPFPSPPEFAVSSFSGHVVLITTKVVWWAEAIRCWEDRGVQVTVVTDYILLEYWATSQDMRGHVSGMLIDESGLVSMAEATDFDHDWLHWMADIPVGVVLAPGRYMSAVPWRTACFLEMLGEEGRLMVYQDRRGPFELLHELRALDMQEGIKEISLSDWNEWMTQSETSP